DGLSQLRLKLRDIVDVACALKLGKDLFGIGNAVGINSVRAETNCPKLFVANRDGIGCAPLLVDLEPRGEEIDVGLERRFKSLIPILQIGEERQVLGVERVQAGTEDICDFSLIDEDCHLRLTNSQLRAVLNLHVAHGVAAGEHSRFGLVPLNDVDELLGEELSESQSLLQSRAIVHCTFFAVCNAKW